MTHRSSALPSFFSCAHGAAVALVAGTLGAALAGCGAAVQNPAVPSLAAVDETTTPDAALALFDRSAREMDRLLPPAEKTIVSAQGSGTAQTVPAAPPPPPSPVAVAPPQPPPPASPRALAPAETAPAKREERDSAKAPATRDDTCQSACRALASMTRAADHLCDLAGAADARCTGAKDRVKSATARVHATCGSC